MGGVVFDFDFMDVQLYVMMGGELFWCEILINFGDKWVVFICSVECFMRVLMSFKLVG